MQKTEEHAMQGVNPGGYYYAVWCRDASYILRDWFLSGHVHEALAHLYNIWSHQINGDSNRTASRQGKKDAEEKIVYGRGSPEENFKTTTLKDNNVRESLDGALPTTIYQAGYSEIYGKNPDIDSTALMISTTSWILSHVLEEYRRDEQRDGNSKVIPKKPMRIASHRTGSSGKAVERANLVDDPLLLANHLSSRMQRAVRYLSNRDTDGDGLLEQGPNEDWMDTALRTGKIVYSQAAWILALRNFSTLLSKIKVMPPVGSSSRNSSNTLPDNGQSNNGNSDMTSQDVTRLAERAVQSVEKTLWSEEGGCYIDAHSTEHYVRRAYHSLTQDVALYLVAITENTDNDSLRVPDGPDDDNNDDDDGTTKGQNDGAKKSKAGKLEVSDNKLHKRSLSTLAAIKKRVWREKWPLVTEALLDLTGPWVLKPFQYHNHTFWPWITGIEMLARSRFEMVDDCNQLLSTLTSSDGHPHVHAYYEWINPLNDKGDGAFPFRTGIAEVRIALTDILANTQQNEKQDR
ncbi:MAG TPA: hypothetical protein VHA09_06035 [Nitrososphaera sp.]|nr:hypothetical protein [Nitrososphaera sp.]